MKTEQIIIVFTAVSILTMMGYSFYACYLSPHIEEKTVKIFDVYINENTGNTYILTVGSGKIILIGEYKDVFELGETYHLILQSTSDPFKFILIEASVNG